MQNKSKTVVVYKSTSALSIVGIIFVVLKLIGEHFHTPVVDWSWWWVTCPFWIIPAIGVGISVGALVLGLVFVILGALLGGRSR